MAKRKGSSSSGPSKVAKKGNETKTSDKGVNDTFRQLTRETRVLDGKLAELSEKESKLENKKRKLEDQRRELEKNEHKVEELKQLYSEMPHSFVLNFLLLSCLLLEMLPHFQMLYRRSH